MKAGVLRRASLVLLGLLFGLLLVGLGTWLYLRAAHIAEVRTAIAERLRLPEELFEVRDVTEEGSIRVVLRDIALLGPAGDTIVAAPSASLWFDAHSLGGVSPIELYDVQVERPFARLIQRPDGGWNIQETLRLTTAGQAVPTEEGRGFRLLDVRLNRGRLILAMPATPPDTLGFASRLSLPVTRLGGQSYQLYTFENVNARLPQVLTGTPAGWRVEVESLSADLVEPEIRIAQLEGWFESEGEDGIRFDVASLRTGSSDLAAGGLIRFGEEGLLYDVEIRADRLAIGDLRPILPTLPEEGEARFTAAIETTAGGRARIAVSDLLLTAFDSRVEGRVALAFGAGGPLTFGETRLELDPLELLSLEQLGLVERLPLLGPVTGIVTSVERPGAVRIDLAAALVPREAPEMEPSRVFAQGVLTGAPDSAPMGFAGLEIAFQPLYLATFAGLAPDLRERLRGEVRGLLTVDGSPSDLRIRGGELAYTVGAVPPTRLTGISGSIALDPALRYEISASAQPLALATLTELFPALPFETTTLAGPINLEGTAERLSFGANLTGPAGGIQFSGDATFEDPLRFAIEGTVDAFTAAAVIRGEVPLQGPMTGRFAARGTAEDLRFDVDLTQALGRFALEGRVQRPTGAPPLFDVAGDVENFRVGALLGQPALFPSPMTGPIRIAGGGGRPYDFDVDLRGAVGIFDVEGFYLPGDVPSYALRGQVQGLDLRRFPLAANLPSTVINGAIEVEGRGATLETLSGTLALDARSSAVGGIPLEVATVRLAAEEGVLRIDTVALSFQNTRLTASGTLGLTQPARGSLRYSLSSPDLSVLSRAMLTAEGVPPQLAGSIQMEGWIAGSVRYPSLAFSMGGRGLRYEDWRAGTLQSSAELTRDPVRGWSGNGSIVGSNLVLAGDQRLQSLRAEASGTEAALAVGMYARRDARSDLSIAGLVEFEEGAPRGLAIESMALRVQDTAWQLASPTRVRWGGVQGAEIQNLVLERSGPAGGRIAIDGRVPPTGTADLRINAEGVDLSDLRRLAPAAPDVRGVLALDLVLEGPVSEPELTVNGRIESFRYQDAAADLVEISAEYLARRLEGTARVGIGGRTAATAEVSLPMRLAIEDLTPEFEMLTTEPLDGRLVADSLPLSLVAAAVPQLVDGTGLANVQLRIGGTLDAPDLAGSTTVRGGAFTIVPLGIRYTEIGARLTMQNERIRIDSLTARSGGTASVGGTVQFEPRAGPTIALTVNMNGFQVMDEPELATITSSGQLALNGQFPRPVLTGRISLDEATIRIPELDQPTGLEIADVEIGQIGGDTLVVAALGPAFLQEMRIEGLEVAVGESVWLSSREARVQITGDLVVFRTGEEFRVFGLLQAIRGRYTLEIGSISREFDVVSGRVQFFGTPDLNPSIDIVAAHRVRTSQAGPGAQLTVLVQLTGTMASPRIRLTSDTPTPLAESDLLSYLIFGRPSFELGGIGGAFAEQLLVQEVLGGILASGLERPILQAGLCDYVRVQPGVNTFAGLFGADFLSTLNAAAIECGREIAENLFLTMETGIGALFGDRGALMWGVGLEWQINQQWSWDLSYGPVRRDPLLQLFSPTVRYQLSTDLRRQWEYGRPSTGSPLDLVGGTEPEEPVPEEPPPDSVDARPAEARPRRPIPDSRERGKMK